ncbi:MAG: hypothetical protein LC768_05985 [Acidobacteria bacterium]|nr:hypothetical protein [Acidobacteriota bacterium]MCA1637873.1 hypothetical protein [Acidobacteriota bacterium]
MNLKKTRLHVLHKAKDLSKEAKTGVSLHCHTENSKEMLHFVPHYAAKLPVISYFWNKERENYTRREGKDIDFSTGFWSPPLTAPEVYNIEKEQINKAGLDAITSITDHDSIEANLQVNEHIENEKAPISLEWTVPYSYGFFHVGVHNLPKDRAVELTKTLLDFTFNETNHSRENLHEMFAMLNALPEVLIVLNHPLWDIEIVGKEKHKILLKNFLKEYGRCLHALEINGFRSWSENKAVLEMAEALNYPVVTGGDRHGCKPNTVINLTNAETFAEFAEEIRVDKRSEVVLMPEYKQPLHSRQLQSFAEILKLYPDFPEGRRKWFDRVHFDIGDGYGTRPLSVHWIYGGPTWLQWAVWTLGIFGSPLARPAFRLAMKRQDIVPRDVSKTKFEIPDLQEIAVSLAAEQAQPKTEFAS